jgi:hypothetical protein
MLPQKLKYQSKIEPAGAKSFRSNIQPQNGTGPYNAGDTIIFNLPTRNNLVYVPTESYLKFNAIITNNSGGASSTYFRFDSMGAHGFIRKIRIFHGSNVLEEIDNYEMLAKMVFDLQASGDASRGKLNILAGTESKLINSRTFVAGSFTDNTTANIAAGLNATSNSVKAINQGALLTNVVANGATFTTQTYCLNLISMIGTLCNEKYFPLFACTAAPVRVEITLVPNIYSVLTTDVASSYTFTNVEYVMNTIELSDSAMATIQSSLNGEPLQFALSSYRNQMWTGNVPTGGTTFAVPLPFKYSSIKSIIIASRNNTNGVGTSTYFPCSSCKFLLSQYYFRIGPNTVPQKAPTTVGEYFAETIKAMGSMSDILYNPAIDYDSFTQETNVACTDTATFTNTTQSGSFYVGLDLENFATADKSSIFSGYNSNTDDIHYFPTHPTQTAVNIRYDAYCNFDQVIKFENGTCYVNF